MSLSQQAHLCLHELIEPGSHQPGQQSSSEDELAAQLSISRLTLGDAPHDLEQEGISQPKHGIDTFAPSYGHRGVPVNLSRNHFVPCLLQLHVAHC